MEDPSRSVGNSEVATPSTDSGSRFSLVSGEGDGFMLGVAAGDTAGGAWKFGYSAATEQVTVISYHFIERTELDVAALIRSLRELDGSEDGESVYRGETLRFRSWLDRAAAGPSVPEEEPSLDSVARTVPVGVIHRRSPDKVTRVAAELAGIFEGDPRSVVAAVTSASAVAASCFGQAGKDLLAGVKEAVLQFAHTSAGAQLGVEAGDLQRSFDQLIAADEPREAEEALEYAGGDADDPLDVMLAGLALVGLATDVAHRPIEEAVKLGGSTLGATVGAILGARFGIRAWPWAFANDTWFAEIGRRVSRGPSEIRDLPIPYAVEQHLISGSPDAYR